MCSCTFFIEVYSKNDKYILLVISLHICDSTRQLYLNLREINQAGFQLFFSFSRNYLKLLSLIINIFFLFVKDNILIFEEAEGC